MTTEEMLEDPNIKEFTQKFLLFTNVYAESEFFEAKWIQFKKEITKPVLYEAWISTTSNENNKNSYGRCILLKTKEGIVVHTSGAKNKECRVTTRFKGYEYFVEANDGKYVYSRLLKPEEL